MCHGVFIHSAVGGCLGHFRVLALVNSAAVNIGLQSKETKGSVEWAEQLEGNQLQFVFENFPHHRGSEIIMWFGDNMEASLRPEVTWGRP